MPAYTAPKYPTEIPSEEDLKILFDDIDMYWAKYHNNYNKEIRAIMSELGLLPKGSYASVKSRLDAIEGAIPTIGFFPIGGIIGILKNLAGCPTPSTNDGWAKCNGTTAAAQGVTNPIITGSLPNINSGVFIRGNTVSWSSGGANGGADSVTISANNLPLHNHSNTFAVTTVALGGTKTFPNTSHKHSLANHVHTNNGTTTAGSPHRHSSGSLKFQMGYYSTVGGITYLGFYNAAGDSVAVLQSSNSGGGFGMDMISVFKDRPANNTSIPFYNTTTSSSGYSGYEASHTHPYTTNTGNPTTNPASGIPSANTSTVSVSGGVLSGSVGNNTTTATALATLPIYINAVYYCRCK